ncbi:unnamed protein product [Paramecium sonneborni]|uniref:Transmembrane protein n=1 Tax=Paramecium sonneborni TaxID=65129 RepID=A0A8S1LEW1_9CILI|nr:unnamed protein product [Paramecium sonneborni]
MLKYFSLFLQICQYLFIIDLSYIQQSINNIEVIEEKLSFQRNTNKIQLDENNSYGYQFWFKFNLQNQNTFPEVLENEFITNKYNSLENNNGFLIFSEWDSLTKQNTVLYFLQPSFSGIPFCTLNVILFLSNQQSSVYQHYIKFQFLEGNWIYTHLGFQRNTNLFQWFIYTPETEELQEYNFQNFENFLDLVETVNIIGGSGKFLYYSQNINLKHIQGKFSSVNFSKGILSKEITLSWLQQIQYPNSCLGINTDILFYNQYLDGTQYLSNTFYLKGKRFIIRGWNKIIINKNQYFDSHIQMIRITVNKDYTDNSYIGDKLFQLIYVLNSDLNKQSGVKANIQRIVQPFQTLYQNWQNTFLDNFIYYDDLMLKRFSNWFYFSFEQGGFKEQFFQLFFGFDFLSLSYDFGHFYMPEKTYQLADVELFILIGGDKFSSRFYYQGYLQNIEILTCLTEEQLYQQIHPYYNKCHGQCKTCNGPTEQNCFSCYEYQNREYYIGKNICSCKFGYSEISNSFICSDIYSFLQKEIKIEKAQQECQININFDGLQVCSSCPEINYKCYDCIFSPNTWILNPLCTKDIVYTSLSSSSMLLKNREQKDYTLYTFDFAFGFQICEGCEKLCVESDQNCHQIQGRQHLNKKVIIKCKESFYFQDNSCQMCKTQCKKCISLNICQICQDGYYLKDGDCFQCQQACSKCILNDQQKIICLACIENHGLIHESCIKCGLNCISCEQSIHKVTSIKFLRCLVCQDNQKFMISFDQQNCIDNAINNCKYGFIYSSQDRAINTLILNQDLITVDTAVIGCALCNDYYEYDIKNQLCQYKFVANCKQSIKDIDYGFQFCLVFTNQKFYFNYSPSFIFVNDYECDRTQIQCVKCLSVSYYQYCLLCKTGYYADLNGICRKCPKDINCKNCFIQSKKYKDNWKSNIRATFQYFFNHYITDFTIFRKLNSEPDDEYEILCYDCWEDYEFYNGLCIQACECFRCVKINNQNICEVSPFIQDYHSLTIIDGKQIDCSTYCQFCYPITYEEMRIINPYFNSLKFSYFSNKCLIPNSKFTNLVYDSDLQQYKKCFFHSNCQIEISFNYFLICQDNLTIQKEEKQTLITINQLFSQNSYPRFQEFENDIFYYYANSQLIENIVIDIEVQDSTECLLPSFSLLNNQFYTNIFSIKNVKLHIFSKQSTNFIANQLFIQDFSFIQIDNVQFKPYFQNLFIFKIDSLLNQQVFLNNLNFTNQKQSNQFSIIMNNIKFIQFKNIYIKEIDTFQNQGIIQISQVKSQQIIFLNLFLINSVITETSLISLINVTFTKIQIDSLKIETQFYNSRLFNYEKSNQNDFLMSKILINSRLINCQIWLNFENQNLIRLSDLHILQCYLVKTKLIQLRDNTLVSYFNATQNQLYEQSILLYFQNGYQVNSTNLLILKNILFLENQCYNNYCLLFIVQDHDQSINKIVFTNLLIFFNYRLPEKQIENIEEYETLIYLSLKSIIIDDVKFMRNFQSDIDNQIPINQMQINNIIALKITSIKILEINQPNVSFLYQLYKCSKLKQTAITNKPIIIIQKFQNLELNSIDISNVINFNSPIIKIQSQKSALIQQDEQILIQNLNFTQNLLLTTQYFYSKSILEISSEQKQTIKLQNFISQFNILHEYIQDYSISSANLLLIESSQSDILMQNLYFISNIVINSSNTQLIIYSNTLQMINSTILKHNLMDETMIYLILSKQYVFDVSVQYFEQLQNYFPIISQTGVGQFHFKNLNIQNAIINQTLGYKGSVFQFYPKNGGTIQINQSNFFNINSQFLLFETKGGCFYILLPSFKINILINNCIFQNVYTQNQGGIIYIESVIDHLVNLEIINVFIHNIFCLTGSIIFLKQNKVDLNTVSNLVLQHVQIFQEKEYFMNYLSQFKLISDDLSNQFFSKRSLIYATYSNISLFNFTVQDIFQEKVLQCSQCQQILIKDLFIHKGINSFSLVQIISNQNQISILFSNVQFLNIINEIDYQTNLICNLKNDFPKFDLNCFTNDQKEDGNLMNNLIFYYDDSYLKTLRRCNFNKIIQQIQNEQSLIQISSQAQIQLIKLENCLFQKIQSQNAIIRIITKAIYSNYIKFKQIHISDNQCGYFGCIRMESNENYQNRLLQNNQQKEFEIFGAEIKIDQMFCFKNNALNGVCLNIENLSIHIIDSLFFNNTASEYGGSIYFSSIKSDQQLLFKFCQFYQNQAEIAGAIYSNSIINSKWIKEYNYFDKNRCKLYGSSIVQPPIKLGITFDNYETIFYPITIYEKENLKVDQIEFNKNPLQNYYNLPSGCELNKYQTVTEDNLYINNQITFRLMGFDSNDEIMKNLIGSSCIIYDRVVDLQKEQTQLQLSELFQSAVNIKSIQFNNVSKDYNLDTIILNSKTLNNSINSVTQLIFFCPGIKTQKINQNYPYEIIWTQEQYFLQINIITLDCQLGEIKNQLTGTCQQCDASQGYYSVVLNQNLCDVQDDKTTAEVKSASLKLLSGQWRPEYNNRYITQCSNKIENCKGGWDVGYDSCETGYFGALCEQCDIYNRRGQGKYSNTESYQCGECQPDYQSVLYAILLNLWNLFSIIFSVKSAQTSIMNQVNKKNQIAVSTFLKIFINYFQLLFVVSTFQLPIPYQITILLGFMGNPVRVISYSLDCSLVDKIEIDIIYLRMIQQILYPFIYLFIMSTAYIIYTVYQKIKINFSYFYIAISYLVLYYSPQILSSLINIMSFRSISNISWVQADVSFQYETNTHYQWIYILCVPLIIFLLFSVSSLFFLLFNKRHNLKKIKSLLYLGYLYLEYNTSSYFWEFVKLVLKILIGFVLTFLQERIIIKGCICLLILALYKSFLTKFKPYKLRNINIIDQQASFICLVSILFGLMLRLAAEIQLNFFPQIIYIFLATLNIAFTLYLIKLILQSYIRQYVEQLDELKQFIKRTFPILQKYKLCRQILQESSTVRNNAKLNFKKITQSIIQKSQLFNKSKLISKQQQQVISLESKIQQQPNDDQIKTSIQLLQKMDLKRTFFNKQNLQNMQNDEN